MTDFFGSSEVTAATGRPASRVNLFDGPLDISWHHCATTADFVGEIFALRLANEPQRYKEVRHSIGYLVNELVENAVKFRVPGEIAVESSLEAGTFRVKVSNLTDAATARRFRALIAEIVDGDPGDLLIRRIEANAADPDGSGSGLGLLTLMSDYGARFAWVFRPCAPEPEHVFIDTYAALPVLDH